MNNILNRLGEIVTSREVAIAMLVALMIVASNSPIAAAAALQHVGIGAAMHAYPQVTCAGSPIPC